MNKRQKKKIIGRDRVIKRVETTLSGRPCLVLIYLRYNRITKVRTIECLCLPTEGKIRATNYLIPRGMTKLSPIIRATEALLLNN